MKEQEAGSGLQGSLAGAREPAADRRIDLPDSPDLNGETPDNHLHDISKILFGAQAITGKAMTSAGRMTVSENETRLHAQQALQQRQDREAREQANLARWNTQMTTVGGVQMTNEQAQNARQNVINNGDAYADWAVRKGLISADQKDEFKSGIQRKKELEDKRGRGALTAAEADEETRLDRSRVGKAIDAATAYDFQHRGQAPVPEATADTRLRNTSSTALDRPALFQSAPDANAAFNTASNEEPLKKPPQAQPVAPSIKATGLDL